MASITRLNPPDLPANPAFSQGVSLEGGIAAFAEFWGTRGPPPAVSVVMVAGLGNPEWLVEISAIAAVEVAS